MKISIQKEDVHSVHSFDIFDTLLARLLGEPVDVFYSTGQRLRDCGLLPFEPETFISLRASAETAARQASNQGDPSLELIYQHLGRMTGLNTEAMNGAMLMELTVEEENLYSLPQGRELLQHSRANADRIVFISDMYLPGTWLERQLQRHQLWKKGDRLFVSNEVGLTKRHAGGLFGYVLQKLNIPPQCMRHHGDNPWADQEMARGAAVASIAVTDAIPSQFEKIASNYSSQSGGMSAWIAGAARFARLNAAAQLKAPQHHALKFCAGVTAPVLTAFLIWVLHSAEQQQITDLYFAASDSDYLLNLAILLAKRMQTTIKLSPFNATQDPGAMSAGFVDVTPSAERISHLATSGCVVFCCSLADSELNSQPGICCYTRDDFGGELGISSEQFSSIFQAENSLEGTLKSSVIQLYAERLPDFILSRSTNQKRLLPLWGLLL